MKRIFSLGRAASAALASVLTAGCLTGCFSGCGPAVNPSDNGSEKGPAVDPFVPAATIAPYDEKEGKMGLYVDPRSGEILLDGRPFYGLGVNSFTLVTRELDVGGVSHYKEQIDLLKSRGIPFMRINFGSYWPEYYERFDSDPQPLLAKMRAVLDYAEEKEMGLICSLLWYDGAISFHVGEKRSAMGDPESKTVAYTKAYVARIVGEFADSPAIWGWEIGNEYNLGADLCDPELRQYLPNGPATPEEPSGFDYYTSEELRVYESQVAAVIREIDPYRMISSGNSEMRPASQALHDAAQKMDPKTHVWTMDWTADTPETFRRMNALYTPDPVDVISFHLQHAENDPDGNVRYVKSLYRAGEQLTLKQYLRMYVSTAKEQNKGLYFGEFGDLMGMEGAEDAAEFFRSVVDTVAGSGIQIASTWQFAANNLIATDRGIDGEKLKVLQEYNEGFAAEGKQDTESYWARFRK